MTGCNYVLQDNHSPDGGGSDNAIGLHVDLIILFRPVYPSTGEVHLTARVIEAGWVFTLRI